MIFFLLFLFDTLYPVIMVEPTPDGALVSWGEVSIPSGGVLYLERIRKGEATLLVIETQNPPVSSFLDEDAQPLDVYRLRVYPWLRYSAPFAPAHQVFLPEVFAP